MAAAAKPGLVKPRYNALGQPVPPGVPTGVQARAPKAGVGEVLAAAMGKVAGKKPPVKASKGGPKRAAPSVGWPESVA